jgi:beta-glucosidase
MTENSQGDIYVGLVNKQANDRKQQLIARYAEENLVGYRWYDAKGAAVAYPFGFGLSYAQFQYSDMEITPTAHGLDVSFVLTNMSSTDAEEVAQVYVSWPMSHIDRPVKELKGFKRVALKAGEQRKLTVPIRRADLCHWDETARTWMLEPGRLTVKVGGSSQDLPLSKDTEI